MPYMVEGPVFPQDEPDGKAGLARAGGITKKEVTFLLFMATFCRNSSVNNPTNIARAAKRARQVVLEIFSDEQT